MICIGGEALPYFLFPNDAYQAMPKDGYTSVFKMILDQDKINVKLSQPFEKTMEKDYHHIFNKMISNFVI